MDNNSDYIIYSNSKAVYHTDKIKALQQGKMITPTLLQVDLEAFCNDNCLFCSYRKDEGYNTTMLKMIEDTPEEHNDYKPIGRPSDKSGFPLEFADRIPEMMEEAGIPAIEITGGGEPTLWRGFDKLIENLKSRKREIGLVTNGSTLSDSRIELLASCLTWIRISMDASNSETHRNVHRTPGHDFDRRVSNIRKIVEQREKQNRLDDMVIGISFVTTPINIDDIESAAEFWSKQGVDHIRFTYMFDKQGTAGLTYDQIEELKKRLQILKQKYTGRFKILFEKDRIDTYMKPNTDFDTCYYQNFVWAVGADANVYPCCIMKYNEKFSLGNLKDRSLKELVEDVNVHSKMTGLDVKSCYPCWLRERNKQIGFAVEKPKHHNFV